MLNAFKIQLLSTAAISVCFAVLIAAVWLAHISPVDGRHTDNPAVALRTLSPPSGVASAEPDPDTAFREEDAGMSASVRVDARPGQAGQSRLDINAVADALTSPAHESAIRGTGRLVELGSNFGIVELPMFAAVISPAPVENIVVYFDADGWIVSYLPHERPAAALWKYDSAAGETANDPQSDEHLAKNLLVIAINEVMIADGRSTGETVPSDVQYYDWTCPQCDAFALFSGVSHGGVSEEIKFVAPYTISLIRGSAAIAITEPVEHGDSVTAGVSIDGTAITKATADTLLNSANFDLIRDGETTTLHRVVIESPHDNSASAAIMLLYDRP